MSLRDNPYAEPAESRRRGLGIVDGIDIAVDVVVVVVIDNPPDDNERAPRSRTFDLAHRRSAAGSSDAVGTGRSQDLDKANSRTGCKVSVESAFL